MTLSRAKVDLLFSMLQASGADLLMDMNLLTRYGKLWNPTNAAEFLNYLNKVSIIHSGLDYE